MHRSTESKAAALKGKVQQIEAAEQARRQRQAAQGVHAQRPGNAPPDLSRMLRQASDVEGVLMLHA
jgi:hypothetical protein